MFAEFLSDIEPFENIVKELEFITYKNNFSSGGMPKLSIYDVKSIRYIEDENGNRIAERQLTNLPQLEITCYKDGVEFYYTVEINFGYCESRLLPSGEIMVNSRFYGYFRPSDYSGWKAPISVLHEDIDTVARFATYYMKLYGYQYASDAKIDKNCDLTSRNLALAKFDDSMIIPNTLRRAILKLKEMDIPKEESLILDFFSNHEYDNLLFPVCWISYSSAAGIFNIETEWSFDEDTLDKHMLYHNRESIHIGYMWDDCYECLEMRTDDVEFVMKMLIDYLMFHNPGLKTGDISVCLSFEWTVATMVYDYNADYDCNADWRYNFYSDGTESSTEQYSRCVELMNKYHEESNIINGLYSDDNSPMSNRVENYLDSLKRFLSTIPSEEISKHLRNFSLEELSAPVDTLQLYYESSASRHPIVTIGWSKPKNTPYNHIELQFYISDAADDELGAILLNEIKSRIKIFDGTNIISLDVGDDISIVSKFLTYYLEAMKIDISKLTYVWL